MALQKLCQILGVYNKPTTAMKQCCVGSVFLCIITVMPNRNSCKSINHLNRGKWNVEV